MNSLNCNLLHRSCFLKWLLALVLAIGFSSTFAQSPRNFDHLTTGFPLTGIHASTQCESCHKNGVFLGTPRACATCHVKGAIQAESNVVRPANHFQTPLPCGSCHTTSTFAGARFDHIGVAPTACASCHNSVVQPGKPFGHIVTEVTCSQCHTTKAWLPATGMDHSKFTDATNCTRCHNGVSAVGKIASHIPTANNCASCHATTGWMPSKWTHSQMAVANQCSVCHTGTYSHTDGKPADHIPYQRVTGVASANCDTCHKNAVVGVALASLSWSPGRLHSNVTIAAQCATCHLSNPNSYSVTGKPTDGVHATVTGNCESCHVSTSVWLGVKPNHSLFNASTNCITCHNGSAAPGQNVGHMPTALNCETCHSPTAAGWKPSKWNHTQMPAVNQCASCHTGGFPPADGKPASHIPYASLAGANNCDSCHRGGYTSWYPGRLHSNITVTGACETCHVPTTFGLTVKPSTPIHSGVTSGCESCHTTTSWFGAKPNHAAYTAATTCSTCHDGTSAPGKNASHFPTSANCLTCHSATALTWKPATNWSHPTTMAGQCSTCHSGAFPPADGKTANHIPYQTLAGNAIASANCDTCHTAPGYVSWNPGRFHANATVTNQCANCHLTTAYGVTGKSTTPIHTGVTGNCESCHTSTSTWFGAKPDHTTYTTATTCTTCHNGTSATGKNGTHFPTTVNCGSCHAPAQSNWKPANWNHTQMPVVAQCATCHTGTYLPADGKSSTHIPYTGLAGAANCDSCHKGGYTTWKPGQLHANISVATQCVTCHQNSTGSSYAVTTKPFSGPSAAVHVSVTGNCESCHRTTTSWASSMPNHASFTSVTDCLACHGPGGSSGVGKSANHMATSANCVTCHSAQAAAWRPSTWKHNQGVAVTGTCTTCHNGTIAIGKPTLHISTTGTANCDTCHASPINVTTPLWKPTTWNHTQMPVTNSCSTCHDGGHAPADGKTANHVPYSVLASATNCDSCHKGGYGAWNPGRVHANLTVAAQCETCHLTTAYGATGKPATAIHASVTGNCESCHSSTTTWLGAKPNHNTYTAATVCTTCHNGTTATGKNGTHFPTTANCVSCHSATLTVWKPSSWNHTQLPVANQCATCHTGGYTPADGKTANHVPYQSLTGVVISNCDTCHKGGYLSWRPGQFHLNVSVLTQCATCHLTTAYGVTGKPATATHSTVTGNCESCHKSTASWLTITYAHAPANAVGTGTCDTCHNGTTAKGKTSTHIPIPVGVKCDACHTSQSSFVNPVTSHAAVVAATCKSCHSGAYLSEGMRAGGALGKPANHIPEAQLLNGAAMDCKVCHTTSVFTSAANWTTLTNKTTLHNGSLGNGSGWCKACHVTGTAYLGNMTRMALAHRGGTSVKTDCSQSGCHRPIGSTGTSWSKWN